MDRLRELYGDKAHKYEDKITLRTDLLKEKHPDTWSNFVVVFEYLREKKGVRGKAAALRFCINKTAQDLALDLENQQDLREQIKQLDRKAVGDMDV